MKCLPASKLPEANGIAIHDWHAEILAIRAFNVFLLHECRRLARGEESVYLLRRPPSAPGQFQPFIWNPEFTIHMYCSEAPCKSSPTAPPVTDNPTPSRRRRKHGTHHFRPT